MAYPANYRYTKQHEWICVEGEHAGRVGITYFAQTQVGEVVFVGLPKVGAEATAGEEFASVESVKAVFEIFAPASGEVIEVNTSLTNAPEKVNQDPHGDAWFAKLQLANAAELAQLMDAQAYEAFCPDEGACA
jgi:glycine cleavage system H protein